MKMHAFASLRAVLVVLAALILLSSCKPHEARKTSSPGTSQAHPDVGAKPQAANSPDDAAGEVRAGGERYSGPPVSVKVLQMESFPVQHAAAVQVTVPTGGWTLQLDRGEIVGGTARVYLTLERPGDGEMVTQAIQELSHTYASATPFTRAAVYIHFAKRDESTLTTNYRLAATSDSR